MMMIIMSQVIKELNMQVKMKKMMHQVLRYKVMWSLRQLKVKYRSVETTSPAPPRLHQNGKTKKTRPANDHKRLPQERSERPTSGIRPEDWQVRPQDEPDGTWLLHRAGFNLHLLGLPTRMLILQGPLPVAGTFKLLLEVWMACQWGQHLLLQRADSAWLLPCLSSNDGHRSLPICKVKQVRQSQAKPARVWATSTSPSGVKTWTTETDLGLTKN